MSADKAVFLILMLGFAVFNVHLLRKEYGVKLKDPTIWAAILHSFMVGWLANGIWGLHP